METKNKSVMRKLACTALSTILLCGTAYGATLQIKNDDTAEVDVTIEAGDGNILNPGKEAIRVVLKEGEEKTVEVKKSELDKDTFSITGKVKMPSLYNKCGPLLINKNYKIIFTGSKTGGTICISEPLN
jgi:hypothetical protein